MKFNVRDVAETGAALGVNYLGTTMVDDNLRWNGSPKTKEEDTVYKDRRLWIGLGGLALEAVCEKDGMLQTVGGVAADGALGSLVTTETLRARVKTPAAPAQLPGGAAAPAPAPDKAGADVQGFWQAR